MFEVPLCEVRSVRNHPNAEKLTIVGFGYGVKEFPEIVSAKLEDGSPRYQVGDWLVYLPENAILPEWLLKGMEFWDEAKGKGTLSGGRGNRLKMRRFAGFESRGALYGLILVGDEGGENYRFVVSLNGSEVGLVSAVLGQNVAVELGITEYVPQ